MCGKEEEEGETKERTGTYEEILEGREREQKGRVRAEEQFLLSSSYFPEFGRKFVSEGRLLYFFLSD